MIKKAVIIKLHGKPIFVADIRDIELKDFIKLQKEAEENLIFDELDNELKIIKDEIGYLKKEIDILKGEE